MFNYFLYILLFTFSFFVGSSAYSNTSVSDKMLLDRPGNPSFTSDDTICISLDHVNTDSLIQNESRREINKKKMVSALFAFPFPFGFMGAHRIMLGTKPWVPVAYVITFGGCFGVLPLIDFFVITFSKDISKYENNPSLFMWLK